MKKAEVTISRAEAPQRMVQKLVNPTFSSTCVLPVLQKDRVRSLAEEAHNPTFVSVMKKTNRSDPG